MLRLQHHPVGVAIPGGFVEIGETAEEAAMRELQEETSLVASECDQYHLYSDPKRDPRFHTASIVFICRVVSCAGKAHGDDAIGVELFKPDDIPWRYMVTKRND